jgi:hypothetical protein
MVVRYEQGDFFPARWKRGQRRGIDEDKQKRPKTSHSRACTPPKLSGRLGV